MNERVTHVGSYRIERELRRDDQHIVYQGWQASLNRPVQITQLTPQAAADSEFAARWKLAARDLRDPGHPQLPRILDAQFGGEQPYLVESYLIADTLADQLGRERDLNDSLRLLAGLADALAYAHKRGWAHGQLAPDQVRIADDGTAYLLDLPWQAAQRPKGDAAAIQTDVRALVKIFCQLHEPTAGIAPELTGWPGEDTPALAAWLAQGQPPEAATASALAQVLAWAWSGDFASAEQLVAALRPLLPGAPAAVSPRAAVASGTIMTPPPGAPAPVVPPPSPPPVTYPTPQPPPAYYPPPQPAQRPGSRRGVAAVAAVLVILVGLVAAGFLLCQTGVLPFCASCDEGLIAQFVNGAKAYIEREAWDEAERELKAAAAECGTCRTTPAPCAEVLLLIDQVVCVKGVDKLISDGEALLSNGDACQAMTRLEEAIAQAKTCGIDASVASSYLARNSDGGAFTLCAHDRLALAAAASDLSERDSLCTEARELLTKAHELKPAAPIISQPYTLAERYAAFREAYDAQDWGAAAVALDELELVVGEQYCGYALGDFRFEISLAQGAIQQEQGRPCEAWEVFEDTGEFAHTLEQQGRLDAAIAGAQTACKATYTPTPIPTATPTPTPVPVLSVVQDQANLRAGPGTKYDALDQKARQGDTYQVVCWSDAQDGTADRWYQVNLPSGQDAWLHQELAKVTGEPGRCASVPPTPTPTPVCYGWSSKVLPTNQIDKPLIRIRAIVRNQNNQPMQGVRVHVWAYNTEFRADTGPNGEYVWAGISQPIDWNVCIFDKVACQKTPFTDNGQLVNIEFRRVQVPCK